MFWKFGVLSFGLLWCCGQDLKIRCFHKLTSVQSQNNLLHLHFTNKTCTWKICVGTSAGVCHFEQDEGMTAQYVMLLV